MGRASKILSINKRFFVIAFILLLLTHIVMGIILIEMSENAVRSQIEQRMLDVSNTAAFQLNGDDLKTLTAADIGTEKYTRALKILASFQEHIQLDYIYALRAEPNGTFTFTIDPDQFDPGDFGKLVETTDALRGAAKGKAGVDKEPHSDEWGNFYSAYSPVFDSKGEVAGIVGVDFNADWYDSMMISHKAVVIIVSMIVLTIGIALAFLTRTTALEGEKDQYRKELEETLQREQEQKQELGSARHLAYTDSLTGVKNKTAYQEATQRIDAGIESGSIKEFGVIVFDLNGLKIINDTLGHESGDRFLKEGCALICRQFCHSPVFRIGGDEFTVLLSGHDYEHRDELLQAFDKQVDENLEKGAVVVSTGIDIFDPETDKSFSSVFERADKKMYERKCLLKSRNIEK